MKLTRRSFIRSAAAAAALAPVAGCAKAQPLFGKEGRDCLIAMCEQIVPADESCGGATEAGVINFIDNWLISYHPEEYDAFVLGLGQFQKLIRENYPKDFQDIPFKEQTEILKLAQAGKLKGSMKPYEQRAFFKKVRDFAMMGFYGSPRHGGNKGGMSFKMMNFDVPLVVGQNRYEGTKVRKEAL